MMVTKDKEINIKFIYIKFLPFADKESWVQRIITGEKDTKTPKNVILKNIRYLVGNN